MFAVRRTWFRLLAVGPLVLLLSVLPSLIYLDHWDEYIQYAVSGSGLLGNEADSLEHTSHHTHCHVGPSTCADQPVPIGSANVLTSVVELPEPELPQVAVDEQVALLEEVFMSPLTRPPQLLAPV
jgi:hypothetical protein